MKVIRLISILSHATVSMLFVLSLFYLLGGFGFAIDWLLLTAAGVAGGTAGAAAADTHRRS